MIQTDVCSCACYHLVLSAQGTDVDACYDTAYWNSFLAGYPSSRNLYDATYDARYYRFLTQSQVEALRSDMCGWRMVSKRGYIGALQGATINQLQVTQADVPQCCFTRSMIHYSRGYIGAAGCTCHQLVHAHMQPSYNCLFGCGCSKCTCCSL